MNEIFFEACKAGDFKKVQEILNQSISKSDLNLLDNEGITALQGSSIEGHKEIVELLIEKGADVNARDYIGKTALHEAVEKGHKEIVELLIKKGADVNAKDILGNSVFYMTLKKVYGGAFENEYVYIDDSFKEIAQLLVKNGAENKYRVLRTRKSNRGTY